VADNTTTPNKGLLKPIVGNSENTWGGYLNTTIDALDAALGGMLTLAITGVTTLTTAQAVNTGYRFTGSLSANANINFPASYHGLAVVRNDTNRSLLCGTTGARVTVLTGQTIAMWSDGVDFISTPIPAGSITAPIMDGSATIGTSINWARADHIHPTDTTLLPKAGGAIAGNLTVNGSLTAGSSGLLFTLSGTTGHSYAFGWTGANLVAYVDGTNVGQVAMQGSFLPIAGGTITGSLLVNGNLTCGDGRLMSRNSGGYQSCVSAWNINNGVAVGFWCETDGAMWFGGCDGTGAPTAGWLQLTSGGNVNIAGVLAGNILVGNNYLRGNNGVYASADGTFGMATSGNQRLQFYANGWYWGWDTQTGQLNWVENNTAFLCVRAADVLVYNNLGRFAGHGAYADLSDERSKLSIEPSKVGLPEIMKLSPIRFRRIMANGDEAEVTEIGFSAQQVKKVIPEAVPTLGIILADGSGGLDSDNPSLGITSEVITAALVNAVKTLERRVKKLEKGNTSGESD